MEGPLLVQRFRYIISLASLAYTFTILHALQYSMQDRHDDDNNSTTQAQNPQLEAHDSTHHSATHNTLATTSTSGTAEKTSGRWTEQEINLLLSYVEENCVLTSAKGLSLKKSEFNRAREIVKSKDAAQCHYKWGHVSIVFVIKKGSDYLSPIIAM